MNKVKLKRLSIRALDRMLDSFPIRHILEHLSIDREELKLIGERTNRLLVYACAYEEEFTLPRSYGGVPREIERKVGTHRFEDGFVVELDDVELVGPDALPVTSDGRYVLENALRNERHLVSSMLSSSLNRTLPVSSDQRGSMDIELAVSLVGPWSTGYFHWFSEWLPRLEGVARYREETGRDPVVLIPRDSPQWLVDSVEYLGFSRLREFDDERVSVSTLLVPSVRRGYPTEASGEEFTNSPRALRWVGRSLRSEVSGDVRFSDERLYISRSKAAERRVVNEAAVIDLLSGFGFSSVVLEDLSLAEQVALFADAEVALGPHGAGLTNMIFGEELGLIELFGDYANACYFTMAEGLGHEYRCLRCEGRGPHLRVDLGTLESVVSSVIGGA